LQHEKRDFELDCRTYVILEEAIPRAEQVEVIIISFRWTTNCFKIMAGPRQLQSQAEFFFKLYTVRFTAKMLARLTSGTNAPAPYRIFHER
jgi:hypothetical protein